MEYVCWSMHLIIICDDPDNHDDNLWLEYVYWSMHFIIMMIICGWLEYVCWSMHPMITCDYHDYNLWLEYVCWSIQLIIMCDDHGMKVMIILIIIWGWSMHLIISWDSHDDNLWYVCWSMQETDSDSSVSQLDRIQLSIPIILSYIVLFFLFFMYFAFFFFLNTHNPVILYIIFRFSCFVFPFSFSVVPISCQQFQAVSFFKAIACRTSLHFQYPSTIIIIAVYHEIQTISKKVRLFSVCVWRRMKAETRHSSRLKKESG